MISFLLTVYRKIRSLSTWNSATKVNTVQWRKRSTLLLFVFRTHQNECHHFLLFLAIRKLQINIINLRWWWLKLVKWMQWKTEMMSFWMIQQMVLCARYSLTRHSLFHNLTVAINTCLFLIQTIIWRTSEVRWLVLKYSPPSFSNLLNRFTIPGAIYKQYGTKLDFCP